MAGSGVLDRRWSGRERVGVAGLAAVVAVAASRGITRSLWYDEGVTAHDVTGSWGDFFYGAGAESNLAFHDTVLRVWSLVGHSELALRLPSLVFTMLTLPVLYAIGRRLLGRPAAAVAVVAFTVNGLVLGYAQEARP